MNNLNFERKFQKKRYFSKPKKVKLKFGDTALVASREGRIELIQLSIIKYFLKRFFKKKKKLIEVNGKIWYFGRVNFFIQKKSKNARMGKGKGMLDRAVIRVKKNFIILEFKGFPIKKLKLFTLNLNKKLNLNFYLFFKNRKNYNIWCVNNKYIEYYDKYFKY